MTHRSVAELFQGPQSSWNYVWHNAFLRITQRGISGTPAGVPFDGVWNGSLWTLFWEAIAYVCLPILGLLGLLKRRSVVLGLLAGTWLLNLGVAYHLLPPNYFLVQGSRLGLMFLCGMALHLYGAQISSRRSAVVAALAILIAAPLLHDYRILGAPALAYLVIWTGASIRRPVLELRNRDISYGMYIYAFTVQQMLVLAGLRDLPAPVFAVIATAATVPLALASWFLVERPMLRLKRVRLRRAVPLPAERPTSTADSSTTS